MNWRGNPTPEFGIETDFEQTVKVFERQGLQPDVTAWESHLLNLEWGHPSLPSRLSVSLTHGRSVRTAHFARAFLLFARKP